LLLTQPPDITVAQQKKPNMHSQLLNYLKTHQKWHMRVFGLING